MSYDSFRIDHDPNSVDHDLVDLVNFDLIDLDLANLDQTDLDQNNLDRIDLDRINFGRNNLDRIDQINRVELVDSQLTPTDSHQKMGLPPEIVQKRKNHVFVSHR